MFQRINYKKLAKKQLKGRFKTAFFATLICFAISALIASPTMKETTETSTSTNAHLVSYSDFDYDFGFESEPFHVENYEPNFLFIWNLISVAISGVLLMAYAFLFLQYFRRPQDKIVFKDFLKGFSLWISGILSIFWYSLWVFLWSLLFVIPGIVKSISYSQMFFIIAENPKISVRKAMQISKVMTKGFKGDLFVMGLSFIGWEILCVLTFFILQLLVTPYEMMSFTNAYKDLKAQAIRRGILTAEDFQ